MRYRPVSFASLLKRVAVYSILVAVIAILYTLAVIGLHIILGNFLDKNILYVSSIIGALLVAFVMSSIKDGIQFFLEKTFFRGEYSHKEILADLSKMMSSVLNLDKLLELILRKICLTMDIEESFVLLKEEGSNFYTIKVFKDIGKGKTLYNTQSLLPTDSDELKLWLSSTNGIAVMRDLFGKKQGSKIPQTIKKIVKEEHIELFVPIVFENKMIGALFAGQKRLDKVFSEEDIDFFQTLSHQVAVAIRNAQLYTELEDKKVYEENILNNLKSGVVVINMGKKITMLNREACRVLNLDYTSVVGKDIGFVSRELADLFSQTLKNGTEFSRAEVVVTVKDRDIPLGANTSFIRSVDGVALGIIMVFTDLTVIKKLEAEKRWADRLANLGTLAAGMAHEIKNPLVAIKTFLQLLPGKFDDESFRKDFLGIACSEVDRINRIIEKLLSTVRPSNSIFEPVDLLKVLNDTLYLMKNDVASKGVDVKKNICTDKIRILGNTEQMTQLFLNLFLNGIESMSENGTLEITTSYFKRDPLHWPHKVPAGDYDESDTVTIKISDTGKGIPPEDINQIFDPFFTTKEKGSGLGLSIVHGIVEEHRGTIDVESKVGEGTSFYVSLPLIKHDAKGTTATEESVQSSSTD